MTLEDLYRRVILDHYRSPRNRGTLDPADLVAEGHNPSCGDDVVVTVRFADGKVEEAKFEGSGCAISMASASMLTEAVKGLDAEGVKDLVGRVRRLAKGEGEGVEGEIQALAGVAKFPVRVKCATLPWTSLELALEE